MNRQQAPSYQFPLCLDFVRIIIIVRKIPDVSAFKAAIMLHGVVLHIQTHVLSAFPENIKTVWRSVVCRVNTYSNRCF